MSSSTNQQPMDPTGPTGILSLWINSVTLADIPEKIQTRAKYLMLDGLACALVGAHLPWSEKATEVVLNIEMEGKCVVFGWERKLSPLSAALLNSTFIQGFELDDWHSEAPLHSNSIIIPSLLATLPLLPQGEKISGKQFLLAYLVGLEVGPRVGNALNGTHILTTGWHSGAVFGPSSSAASTSKLLSLPPSQIEDALGIACTQACGLMSAQFESECKRMQHGFAARAGVLATQLAKGGYTGIKKVYEREYGGFLDMFSKGSGMDPQFNIGALTEGLGNIWKTSNVKIKPYACMAATHGTIDCIHKLQTEYADKLQDLSKISEIVLSMSEVAFHHGGQDISPQQRPLSAVGAQMSCSYIAITQLVDSEVTPRCFAHSKLDRDLVWSLISCTTCTQHNETNKWMQSATITFQDGTEIKAEIKSPKGVDPEMSNEEILEKWRGLCRGVIDDKRREEIEKLVLGLEGCEDVEELCELMGGRTENPIA